jgi:hypothetical protein
MSGSLKSLLEGLTPALDTLAKKAAAAQTLTEKVRRQLPEPLQSHLVAATRRGADLVVIMDSAAWTPRVRYAARTLKAGLESEGEPVIGKLQVKVRAAAQRGAKSSAAV